MQKKDTFDVIVVGGEPSGSTAATEHARDGLSVMLLDKAGRIKPCGGAVPSRLIRDFDIPDSQIVAKINSARIISPSGREVDMPVGKGYVGMIDREHFDEWLRNRAAGAGAERRTGHFKSIKHHDDGMVSITYTDKSNGKLGEEIVVRARAVVSADGTQKVHEGAR